MDSEAGNKDRQVSPLSLLSLSLSFSLRVSLLSLRVPPSPSFSLFFSLSLGLSLSLVLSFMLLIHKKASQLDKRLSCVSIQKDSEVSSTGPWTSTETVTDACEQHKDSRLANAGRARGWRQTWMPTKSRRL